MRLDRDYLAKLRRDRKLSSAYFCEGTSNHEMADFHQKVGAVTTLLLATPQYVNFQISSIGVWIVPAVRTRQIRIFFDNRGRPIGYVTWAYLTCETETRWINDSNTIFHPSEWNEGDRLWIIDLVSPYGYGLAIMRFVRERLFGDARAFNWLRRRSDGQIRAIRCWTRAESR